MFQHVCFVKRKRLRIILLSDFAVVFDNFEGWFWVDVQVRERGCKTRHA